VSDGVGTKDILRSHLVEQNSRPRISTIASGDLMYQMVVGDLQNKSELQVLKSETPARGKSSEGLQGSGPSETDIGTIS
jgi:hypothetical protein